MKKTILLFAGILILASCSNESVVSEQEVLADEAVQNPDIFAKNGGKVSVCHFAKSDNIWELVEVNEKSLENHLKHGDVVLVDADGDGYVTEANECLPVDCDDTDSTKTDNCCILTDATIKDAVNLWLSDQPSAEAQYGHISNWCTSNITNISYMFSRATSFNQDISAWDVSKVTDMSHLFSRAT